MYRLTHNGETEEYASRTRAIRALAGAVRAQPLTDGERKAFDRWYTNRNFRSVSLALYNRNRYELRVSVAGERRTFAIDPSPPLPHEHPAQVPVTHGYADTV